MKISHLVVINLLILFTCKSCTDAKNSEIAQKGKNSIVVDSLGRNTYVKPFLKTLEELLKDSCSVLWYAGDAAYFMCFEKDKVHFLFSPSCDDWFKTRLDNNKLIFIWGNNADCNISGFLNKNYGLAKHPMVNKPFGGIALVNDSTLKINYYYTDWIKKVNQEVNMLDTIFPIIFRLKRK